MMQPGRLAKNIWRKSKCATKPFGQVKSALLLLALLFTASAIIEGAILLHTYWRLQIAAREAAQWAVTCEPQQGHHLDRSPCMPGEDCFDETYEDYMARRVAFIKAIATARVQGRQEVKDADVPYLLKQLLVEPVDVEIWGFSSFLDSEATRDHPGAPGLPVKIQLAREVNLVTPVLSVIFPSVRLAAAVAMINEGIQVGFGNVPPPSFDTSSKMARETNSSFLAIHETADVGQFIVMEGRLDVEVDEIDTALERIAQITGNLQGYITNQQVWREGETRLATITVAVPDEEFENVMRQLRGVASHILSEEMSGRDVTSQYIDLEGRLHNQRATRDRVLTILEQATTVEEALQVSRELSSIEEKIEGIQGQLNQLHNRVFFSTITMNLAHVSSAGSNWQSGRVADKAFDSLKAILQGIGNVLIWVIIVIVPLFLIMYVLVWGGRLIGKRFRRKSTPASSANGET